MWSFYDRRARQEPFRRIGRKAGDLHRRLGLGHIDLSEEQLLVFSCRLPTGTPGHVPTAFDAKLGAFFRPGGRTKPLKGPDNHGMPEVVHDPVTGRGLVERIQKAR